MLKESMLLLYCRGSVESRFSFLIPRSAIQFTYRQKVLERFIEELEQLEGDKYTSKGVQI